MADSSAPAPRAAAPARQDLPVLVVGGGQAGLSASFYLTQARIPHRVFESHRLGHAWRDQRWDSFCLVTPNWQCALPEHPYAGAEPTGFMLKSDIVAYVESFAARFSPPLAEGVTVTRVARQADGRFAVDTTAGLYTAGQVIVAVGGYHVPTVPACAAHLPPSVRQLHARDYRNPESLPPGAVLVVGTGQSGCQIAEDLHLAGRTVHLCVGGAPRAPRVYRGRDAVEWLDRMGHYDLPVDDHPSGAAVRAKANHYLTGRDGGREIDLRQRALEGLRLHGRLLDIDADGRRVRCGSDLAQNLDRADASAASIKAGIDAYLAREGIDAPPEAPYTPPWQPSDTDPSATAFDLVDENITSVIWAIGYRPDFSWIDGLPRDARGFPEHRRGASPVEGLYFLGLPWLYTWGSGRFAGVARDAAFVVDAVVARASDAPALAGAS